MKVPEQTAVPSASPLLCIGKLEKLFIPMNAKNAAASPCLTNSATLTLASVEAQRHNFTA
ncbi:hypothetical protein EBR21_12465 [bacterium]|nr:hypothetical protein [bacterium]